MASPAVLLWIAQLVEKTDAALAEKAARAAIDDFGPTPWTAEAFLRLGDLAFERRDWPRAESAFNKAVRELPDERERCSRDDAPGRCSICSGAL